MNGLTTVVGAVQVRVDGRKLSNEDISRLATVRVTANLAQPAQCELTFTISPGATTQHRLCPLGADLKVSVHSKVEPLFRGEVTCFELDYAADGTALLRVRAYDRLHRLRKSRRPHVFESVTAAELARRLTGAQVIAPDEGPTLERVVQHCQHDYELLLEVTGKAGLYPVQDGDELRLVTLAGHGTPIALRLGDSLLQVCVEANLDQTADGVTALGWHPQRAELISQRAGDARSGRRIPLRTDPSDVDADDELLLVDRGGRSDDELRASAQAELDRRTAATVVVTGTAQGDPRLRPGRRIALTGVAAPVAGAYVVTSVTHTVDARGYLTQFRTDPPPRVAPERAASVTLGKVTDVDDPDHLGRVRVTLPAYADLDAGWLGVLCAGAGQRRGLVALPDVDDTVLVALPHGQPVAGIVLGGLYGTVSPPDSGVVRGRVRRWSLRTSDGQSFVVDDDDKRLRLRNAKGSFIELSPDLLRVHAKSDLVIEAPGRAVRIRGKTVDFVHAESPEEVRDASDH